MSAAGRELDAYLVFTHAVPRERAERVAASVPDARLEVFTDESRPDLVRAARLSGGTGGDALNAVRAALLSDELRWAELGVREYVVIDGAREWRPWRRNAYLSRDALRDLASLETGVRYHAPA